MGEKGKQDDGCRTALTALADGRLDEWKGLGACRRADVEGAFGASGNDPSASGAHGTWRIYPAVTAAPYGFTVWFDGDRVIAVHGHVRLARAPEDLLGPPEAKLPSRLSSDWSQWVYASRGLALHVGTYSTSDPREAMLYAFPATTPEAFATSWIAAVENRETRLDD